MDYEDASVLRQAMIMASNELNRTMRNCELRIYLNNIDIKVISGDAKNVIHAVRSPNTGEIEWKFLKKSFLQGAWDVGRGFASLVGNFFHRALPIASRVTSLAIGWPS